MKPIFEYISNAKYSTKYLKGEYAGNNFLLLDVYLNEKGSRAKIKLLTIFNTAKSTVILLNFLVWKLCRNSSFPQNFHTRKLGEITVFFAV